MGHDKETEKQAFINFVDWAFKLWCKDPCMHIYHYGSYEVTALRRLMGSNGIKEYEVDMLLRNEVFVDLYNIIRNGVLIGEPNYSIKMLNTSTEIKKTEVASGGESIVAYEEWRANPDGLSWETSQVLEQLEITTWMIVIPQRINRVA